MTAELDEIFVSIQGEGLLIGQRQLFIRFKGCNLRCSYCDTTAQAGECRLESVPGSGRKELIANPVSAAQLRQIIARLKPTCFQAISLTGGEPLLHTAFIADLLANSGLKEQPVYLETNGTLPLELAQIVENCRIIAMDIKLPSATGVAYWEEHQQFLRLARTREVMVKVIVNQATTDEEILATTQLVAGEDRRIPLILQPVTPRPDEKTKLSPNLLLRWQELALSKLADVRVIPQVHPWLGVL